MDKKKAPAKFYVRNSRTRRIRLYGFGGAARVARVPHQNWWNTTGFSATSTPRQENQTQKRSHVT
jgi:hypothetical protein